MLEKNNILKICGARSYKTLCLTSMVAVLFFGVVQPVLAQSNDVLNRINRLENELDTLNRAVYRGETPPAATSYVPPVYNAGASSGSIQNGEVRLQELETQIRDLTGKVEEQRYEQDQLMRKIERLEQQLQEKTVVPVQPQANTSQFATPQAAVKAATPGMSVLAQDKPSGMNIATPKSSAVEGANQIAGGGAPEPTLQYEQAFADLKNERYDAAQKGFDVFLANYKDHSLASNAKYWLGETYYVRGKFDQAARVFAEGYRTYPESTKAPDNLLKLGMSLAGMGKTEDACIALGQLPKKHPDGAGPVLRRGDQERERLKCK